MSGGRGRGLRIPDFRRGPGAWDDHETLLCVLFYSIRLFFIARYSIQFNSILILFYSILCSASFSRIYFKSSTSCSMLLRASPLDGPMISHPPQDYAPEGCNQALRRSMRPAVK